MKKKASHKEPSWPADEPDEFIALSSSPITIVDPTEMQRLASVAIDSFGSADPWRVECEVRNELCRRRGLPARQWLFDALKQHKYSPVWLEANSKQLLKTGEKDEANVGISISKTGTYVSQYTSIIVIDVDAEPWQAKATELLGKPFAKRYLASSVKTKRGAHIYVIDTINGDRYVKKDDLTVMSAGWAVAPGSEVAGHLYTPIGGSLVSADDLPILSDQAEARLLKEPETWGYRPLDDY